MERIVHVVRMSISGNRYCRFEPGIIILYHCARHFIRIASVVTAMKYAPAGHNLVKGRNRKRNHAFSFIFPDPMEMQLQLFSAPS